MTDKQICFYVFWTALVMIVSSFMVLITGPSQAYYTCLDKIEIAEIEEFDKLITICERLR